MIRAAFLRLLNDSRGSMAIETAIVAPVLILMSIGTFEVARMVSRQQELQSAAGEGETIALAVSQAETATSIATVRDIIAESVGLPADKVILTRFYRCNADETLVSDKSSCASNAVVTSYLKLELRDRYTPVWTQFGVGSTLDYDVERWVQL